MSVLCECHGHIMLNGCSYKDASTEHEAEVSEKYVRKNLKDCAEKGIVYYRDGGDKYGVSVYAKKIASEYGLEYRTPCYIIHKKGFYGGMFGRCFEDMDQYRTLVREAGALGADFIKLTASGMLDFSGDGGVTGKSMSLDELRQMIAFAHVEGFSVMIHANGAENIKNALIAGADSIEHGFYINDECINLLIERSAVWVPTLVTVANLIGSRRFDDSLLDHIASIHRANIAMASEKGALIACGSDSGASGVLQGSGTLDEHAALTSLGVDHSAADSVIRRTFIRRVSP